MFVVICLFCILRFSFYSFFSVFLLSVFFIFSMFPSPFSFTKQTIIHSRFVSSVCTSERDSSITKASEAFIITVEISERKASQSRREVYFTFKVEGTYTLLLKKKIAEELQPSLEFDGSKISACFSNILEKFTIKQADIMGSFAEVLANNETKNINKISN